MLMGVRMSDSSLSERRQSLGTKPWFDAMNLFLSKGDSKSEDPSNTYVGLRLVAVDGTSFSCGNTPAFKEEVEKTWTRRGRAAFFRIPCVALYDLCTHRPMAVQIGQDAESESVLAAQIIHHLGETDLLIADRYYGSGKWVARLSSLPTKPMFLIRVKESLGAIPCNRLQDGSRLVQVKDPDTGEMILVREIKFKLRRLGGKWINVRFWTNLLDAVQCPAIELVGLYAMRWEQEIAFREIKQHLHGDNILASHTPSTAVQEICALFMAQAIIASERKTASKKQAVPVLEISFEKTLATCRHLCWLWRVAGNEIGDELWGAIVKKVEQELAWEASKPRRARSCPRKVRQPIKKWARLFKNHYEQGPIECRMRKS